MHIGANKAAILWLFVGLRSARSSYGFIIGGIHVATHRRHAIYKQQVDNVAPFTLKVTGSDDNDSVLSGSVTIEYPKEEDEEQSSSLSSSCVSSHLFLTASNASNELNRLLEEAQQVVRNHQYESENSNSKIFSTSTHLQQRQQLVALEGFISGRRALGSSLLFVDIVLEDDDDTDNVAYIQALLKRNDKGEDDDVDNESSSSQSSFSHLFNVYFKVLQPGTRVRLVGQAGPSHRPSESLLLIQSVKLIAPNNNPQHLKNVLRFAMSGDLPMDDIARALSMESTSKLAELLESCDSDDNSGQKRMTDHFFFTLAKQVLESHPNRGSLLDSTQLFKNNANGSDQNASITTTALPPANREVMAPPDWVLQNIARPMKNSEAIETNEFDEKKFYSIRNALNKCDDNSFLGDEPISVVGWVRNRRRHQNSIVVLDIVDNNVGEYEGVRMECILNPAVFRSSIGNAAATSCDIYGQLLCAGSRVMLHGFVERQEHGATQNDAGTQTQKKFWIRHSIVLRSSWRPAAIQYLLEMLQSSNISVAEAANALELPGGSQEAEALSQIKDPTKLRWKAAEISRSLQDASSRMGKVTPELEQVLDQYSALRRNFPASADNKILADNELPQQQQQQKTAPLSYGDVLLRSRYEVKKKPQVEWMIRQIEDVIQSHPGERPLQIVDIGGGKGYLANAIAQRFGSEIVNVRVIDISSGAIIMGKKRANRSSIDNIRFDKGDASTVDLAGSVDIVVSLHGCGVLTDVAIGHAISSGAAFVVCPCCFRSNPSLKVTAPFPVASAVASDQQRNIQQKNQLLSASDWLNIDFSDHEKLKQLAEIQGDINLSSKAIHTICALRAQAAKTRVISRIDDRNCLEINIKTFPISLSTRNFCIVGKLCRT